MSGGIERNTQAKESQGSEVPYGGVRRYDGGGGGWGNSRNGFSINKEDSELRRRKGNLGVKESHEKWILWKRKEGTIKIYDLGCYTKTLKRREKFSSLLPGEGRKKRRYTNPAKKIHFCYLRGIEKKRTKLMEGGRRRIAYARLFEEGKECSQKTRRPPGCLSNRLGGRKGEREEQVESDFERKETREN